MATLSAKIRKDLGKKSKKFREKGIVPAILYGPKTENIPLEINLREFEKVYRQAGESSLIQLQVDKKNFLVLIHALEIEAISQKPIHIDFYQPKLDEEVTVTVPLTFAGEAPAVKELAGTLVKNIYELEVRALPQNLPHEIRVDIGALKTFEDAIFIKDLVVLQKGVKILKEPDETVVFVAEPEEVEEELAKAVEEKVEEVEKVEKVEEKKEETE